jgi:elongation factor 1-beta
VYEAVKKQPAEKFINALRWYKHISSYSSAEQSGFTGDKKDAVSYLSNAAGSSAAKKPESKPKKEEEEDDDIDLFGSDDEVDEEAERLKEQRLAEYRAKKSAKPKVIAKSSIVLDVKPWDDETDMVALEEGVRAITMEGLLWGASKLVAVGYGIKKLQISCVVEDDKVGMEDLEEKIRDLED